jgi:hypothetical protein
MKGKKKEKKEEAKREENLMAGQSLVKIRRSLL